MLSQHQHILSSCPAVGVQGPLYAQRLTIVTQAKIGHVDHRAHAGVGTHCRAPHSVGQPLVFNRNAATSLVPRFVAGVIADVVDPRVDDAIRDRLAQQALPQRSVEDAREDREDVDPHGRP